jgi:ubiquinone/menaquinone biosynthesis C-methylase UbiE
MHSRRHKSGDLLLDRWIQGDAQQLPFSDNSFDAATMGYGLRNVANIPRALGELHRVLRPGAKMAVLDFNNSTSPAVDAIQVRNLWT